MQQHTKRSWKIQLHETMCHINHVLDLLNRKQTAKESALMEAVEWCRLNGHRGWKAVSSGLFPGIKDS